MTLMYRERMVMTAEEIPQQEHEGITPYQATPKKSSFILPFLIGLASGMAIFVIGTIAVRALQQEQNYLVLPTPTPTAALEPEEESNSDEILPLSKKDLLGTYTSLGNPDGSCRKVYKLTISEDVLLA